MEVKSKKTDPLQVATLTHVGPYEEVSKLYAEIMKWLRQKRLEITGLPFGWFYDNPEKVPSNRLRSEVGIPFKGQAESEDNIKVKKIPAQEVLFIIRKGPYMEVGPAYSRLFQHAEEKGYTPQECLMEIYLNDPAKVPESELLTEVQLPVKKN